MALPGEFNAGPLRLFKGAPPPAPTSAELLSAHGFTLHPVLSREECRHYIADSERLGYASLASLYAKDYRDNDRRIVMSPELASILWARIGGFFRAYPAGPSDERHGVAPGVYDPIGLNECFKFCRYEAGGHFNVHRDSAFVRNAVERSLFTVMVYLNDEGFSAGETEFMSMEQRGHGLEVQETVRPRAGMAVCFYHYHLHGGARVDGGRKYILRTDVMFRRR